MFLHGNSRIYVYSYLMYYFYYYYYYHAPDLLLLMTLQVNNYMMF